MAKFRKKPVVIEAVRVAHALADAANNWRGLVSWLKDAYDKGTVVFEDRCIHVHTLEGVMVAGWDDWIIQGVKGELYPCKDDIFKATYDVVEG